jgi:hypothetical protein
VRQGGDLPDSVLDQSERLRWAEMARSKNRRQVGSPPKLPSHWTPFQVISPDSQLPFTEPGAWQYIADLLEQGHPTEELVLDVPPGVIAHVMHVPHPNGKVLYIKFHLGLHNKIVGRSFHYSERM